MPAACRCTRLLERSSSGEVGYVKTGEGLEVDFLSRRTTGEQDLIQVCADVSQPETLSRDIRALASAAREHPRAKPRLLVLDRDSVAAARDESVRVAPAYEWLLAAANEE